MRKKAPQLPQMTEHDVLRHYLHLSQMTLGMMGVSLLPLGPTQSRVEVISGDGAK